MSCRQLKARAELVRLVFDYQTRKLSLAPCGSLKTSSADNHSGKIFLSGRSAYLCPSKACLAQALETMKLKNAIEGRRKKGIPSSRQLAWPLEAQLIKALSQECTDREKTCQNT